MSHSGRAAENPEILISPCAKLPSFTPDSKEYPQAGEPMDYLMGTWEVEQILCEATGPLRRLGPSICIEIVTPASGACYQFSFDLQKTRNIQASQNHDTYIEHSDPKSCYSLYAYRVAQAEKIVVTIKVSATKGGEDNDTVTFTATKIENSERPA
ncbi:MAG TPA: hypothetical protein VMW27_23375 [Thermoanaerobaculia bacterium]|nr:hypothetical protein [Thermoanaerobaculia bacterium]